MKRFLLLLLLLPELSPAQSTRVHAHNDYQQPEPLLNALEQKAYSIEADVYLYKNELRVAHNKKDVPAAPLLDSLYLIPLVNDSRWSGNGVSADSLYAPVLMIDIKEEGPAVLQQLSKLLQSHSPVFDKGINRHAVQVVISGDRGPIADWATYPYLLFDGRPYEQYDAATLQQVAFISDNYNNYVQGTDSSRLFTMIQKVHGLGKMIRLWGCPDDAASWKRQLELGIDIINTDKVAELNLFLQAH